MPKDNIENFNPSKKKENSITQEQSLNMDEVFKDNPEIATIFNNNKELFQEYLNSIFPDSKVKDIVWHGTSQKFEEEKFDKSKLGTSTNNITNKLGFYFVPDKKVAGLFIKGKKIIWGKGVIMPENSKIYPVVLLMKDIETIEGDVFNEYAKKNEIPPLKLDGDSILITPQTYNIVPEFINNNYIVFESEQIHMIGSKQDLEQAKDWLKNKNN